MDITEYRKKQNELQDKDLSSIRKIKSLIPFVPDLKNDIDKMMTLYNDRTQVFYDYIGREDSDEMFSDFRWKIDELLMVLHVILTDISNKISQEIDKWEKGVK